MSLVTGKIGVLLGIWKVAKVVRIDGRKLSKFGLLEDQIIIGRPRQPRGLWQSMQ